MAFLSNFGIPSPTDGANGDNWLNFTSGSLFLKTAGDWLPVLTFASSNFFRTGSGVPATGLGANGDYYLDEITLFYYQKVAGVWVLIFRKGGSTAYYSGVGAPSISGGNGDHYLNQSNGDVYQFFDGIWNLVYTAGGATFAPVLLSTSAATQTYVLASKWLVGWEVKSDAAQTAKLGTTASGSEMGEADLLANEIWVGQGNMSQTFTSQTIYFSGLTGNNNIKLWILG